MYAMPSSAKKRRNAWKEAEEHAVIGAHADYRREDFVFSRTQSPQLRELEWESRIKPLKPWVPNFAANLAMAIFA